MSITNAIPASGAIIERGTPITIVSDEGTPANISVTYSPDGGTPESAVISGAIQTGYSGSISSAGGSTTILIRRDAGWEEDAFTLMVSDGDADTVSYNIVEEGQYPPFMEPFTSPAVGVGGGHPVQSVFARTGNVLAVASDYNASQVDNDSGVTGATVADALDTLDGAGGSSITVEDDGTPLTTSVVKFNYKGAGVVLSEPVADEIDVTISGAAVPAANLDAVIATGTGTPDNDATVPDAQPLIFRETTSAVTMTIVGNQASSENSIEVETGTNLAKGIQISDSSGYSAYMRPNQVRFDNTKDGGSTYFLGVDAGTAADGCNLSIKAGDGLTTNGSVTINPGSDIGADGSVTVGSLPGAGVNIGSATGNIDFATGFTVNESIDHPLTPVAGSGQFWVRSTDEKPIYTDGTTATDYDLTAGGTLDDVITGTTVDNDVDVPAADPVILRDGGVDLTPLTVSKTGPGTTTPAVSVSIGNAKPAIEVLDTSNSVGMDIKGNSISPNADDNTQFVFGAGASVSTGAPGEVALWGRISNELAGKAGTALVRGGDSANATSGDGGDVSLEAGFKLITGNNGSIKIGLGGPTEIELGQGFTVGETADHPVAPTAGKGQYWARSSDGLPVFTDNGGVDHELASPVANNYAFYLSNYATGGGDPGAGEFTTDSATASSITSIRLNDTAATVGGDFGAVLANLAAGDRVVAREAGINVSSAKFFTLNVVSVADNGNDKTIACTNDSGFGTLSAGESYEFLIVPVSAAGSPSDLDSVVNFIGRDNDLEVPSGDPIVFRDGGVAGTTPLALSKSAASTTDATLEVEANGSTSLGVRVTDSVASSELTITPVKISQEGDTIATFTVGGSETTTVAPGLTTIEGIGTSTTNKAGNVQIQGGLNTNATSVDGGDVLIDGGAFTTIGSNGSVVIGGTAVAEIEMGQGITIRETADHPVPFVAGKGQHWVRSSDGKPIFTDDSGTDFDLTAGTGDVTAGAAMANNAIIRGDGGASGIQDSGIVVTDTDDIVLPDDANTDIGPGDNATLAGPDITIHGGDTASNTGGAATIKGGEGGTGTGGDVNIEAGGGATADGAVNIGTTGGEIQIGTAGAGGGNTSLESDEVSIPGGVLNFGDGIDDATIGPVERTGAVAGTNLTITGGAADGSDAGGDLILEGGDSASGTDGEVTIGVARTSAVTVGATLDMAVGNITLTGGGTVDGRDIDADGTQLDTNTSDVSGHLATANVHRIINEGVIGSRPAPSGGVAGQYYFGTDDQSFTRCNDAGTTWEGVGLEVDDVTLEATTDLHIKDAGVDTTQLADDSVTVGKIDPTGGSEGQVIGISGGNPAWVLSSSVASALATTGADVNVNASAAPTIGQVLKATSGTTATWQPEAGGTVILQDLFANRPAAGTTDRLFIATDTRAFSRDNGAAWDDVGILADDTTIEVDGTNGLQLVGFPAASTNESPRKTAGGAIEWVDLSGGVETNDLATDGIAGIADDQLAIGTGAGTAAYQTLANGAVSYNTATGAFSQAALADLSDGGTALTSESNNLETTCTGIVANEIVFGASADTASYSTIAALTDEPSPTTGDVVLIQTTEGLRKLDVSNFPAGSETNNLAGDGIANIADDQLAVGTGSGTAGYQTLSNGAVSYNTTTGAFAQAGVADLSTATEGTGSIVLATSPAIVTPTIASFTNAQHDHADAAGGGQIAYANITGTPAPKPDSVYIETPADGDVFNWGRADRTFTIARVDAVLDDGTSVVVSFDSGASRATSDQQHVNAQTCNSTTTGTNLTKTANLTIESGDWRWFTIGTVTGATGMTITVSYS